MGIAYYLDPDEIDLIRDFRTLSQHQQDILAQAIHLTAEVHQYRATTAQAKVVPLRKRS